MVVVTHEMDFAKRVANWVSRFDQGKVVEQAHRGRSSNNRQCQRTRDFLSHLGWPRRKPCGFRPAGCHPVRGGPSDERTENRPRPRSTPSRPATTPQYVGRRDGEGYAHAPQGTWLGIRVDWPAVEAASFFIYELTAVTCSGKISEGETR